MAYNNHRMSGPPAHFENLFINHNFIETEDEDEEYNEPRRVRRGSYQNNNHININNINNNNYNYNNNHYNNNNHININNDNINNNNNNINNSINERKEPSCWIFGYGSLCWYPGFSFDKCLTGYIRGYVRRFWQGNVTHRGTEQRPGRVATLVEDKKGGITWGCAYRITGENALEYLKKRECTLGGYATFETKFYPRVASYDTPFSGEALSVIVYIATPENIHWLGDADPQQIATEILESRGPSGHNIEYLLRLANFMREEIPNALDDHLFELELLVLQELHKRQIPLWTVMGVNPERIRRDSHENIKYAPSFEFSSRVSERKLRCLNI